jgi:hypothetical protein
LSTALDVCVPPWMSKARGLLCRQIILLICANSPAIEPKKLSPRFAAGLN